MVRKAENTTQDQPTFDPALLQGMIDQAVERILATKAQEQKAERSDTVHKAIIRAFEKAGYRDVILYDSSKTLPEQPNVSILTFQKWFELGRRVKEGERALRIRGSNLRLYHRDQTRIATPAERKENFAKVQEKAARREAKAQPSQPTA
jgi:hypothetical protein